MGGWTVICFFYEGEVRAGVGEVALTQNEWFTAQRLKDDYYLYVVFNAVSSPRLILFSIKVQNLPIQLIDQKFQGFNTIPIFYLHLP